MMQSLLKAVMKILKVLNISITYQSPFMKEFGSLKTTVKACGKRSSK